MATYNKLVRDKIPEIIHESGQSADYYIAPYDEYKERLFAKLLEELNEFIDTPCVEEAADIWEVFISICKAHEINISDVMTTADEKASSRGKFDKGIILRSVQDTPQGHI